MRRLPLWLLIPPDLTCPATPLRFQHGWINRVWTPPPPKPCDEWVMGCPRGANEERPAGLPASCPVRSQTERASCFHRSGNDLSSEVPESHAPADRRLFTHKERRQCRPSGSREGGRRRLAFGFRRASYLRADRRSLTLRSAALEYISNRSNFSLSGRLRLRFPRSAGFVYVSATLANCGSRRDFGFVRDYL